MQDRPKTPEDRAYRAWSLQTRPNEFELKILSQRLGLLRYLPAISVLLTVTDEDEIWIKSSVSSVLDQLYPRLELCVCDNGSTRPHVQAVVQQLAASHDRVKICALPEKGDRARAYNEALELATGEHVALLEPGDELSTGALIQVAEALDRTGADLLYTDEDEIDVAGRPSVPIFKPAWCPDLLLSTNYIGRLGVLRKDLVEELGGFRKGIEGAEEHDLALRLAERTSRVRHLPGVHYHRRRLPRNFRQASTETTREVVREALLRQGTKATVEEGSTPDSFRIAREVPIGLRVSVILPGGGASNEYRRSLEESAGYPIHELLGAGSEAEGPGVTGYNSSPVRALNLAARRAEGEYLVFLGKRVTPLGPDWLAEMLRQARRPEVGAVGGRLLDANKDSISIGRILDLTQLTGNPENSNVACGTYPPLSDYPGNFPASARWMSMRRDVFEDAGGFDDRRLRRVFYDLDLCFRFEEMGLINVYTPYASAVYQKDPPLQPNGREIAYMWSRWWDALVRTLYYSSSPMEQWSDPAQRDAVLAATLSGSSSKVW